MRLALLLFFLLELHLCAQLFEDHYQREVKLPQKVSKIFVASPSLFLNLLAFDPALVCGLNAPFTPEQKPFVGSAFHQKVVGGLFGGGANLNFEKVATLHPDVAIIWGRMSGAKKIVEKFEALGIPVLMVKNDSIEDIAGQFALYGALSGDTHRAKRSSSHIPKRPSLYLSP